jgi:superfamily II DNA or RNA helicase
VTRSPWALNASARDWQVAALRLWREQGDQGIVAVVTGGGKTFFAYQCMADLHDRVPTAAVTVIVPTVALLDQWFVGLTEDLHLNAQDIAVFSGGSRPRPAAVNLMVINSARDVAPRLVDGERQHLLVVDECHRAASPENARALVGPYTATLGLSATPEREFDDLFESNVVPALGPIIYRYGYEDASRDRVISPFMLTNVEVPLRESEQAAYDRLTRQVFLLFKRKDRGEDVDGRLAKALRDRARVSSSAELRIPATIRILSEHRRHRSIVFHEQIYAANVIAEALRQQGHRVAAYHSGLGPQIRQDNLRLFRRGEIDVLVTCRALDEGINVPDASVAVIAASTASTRQRIQRLGRVLRPAPGKESAEIYTIYASEPEATRLRAEEEKLRDVRAIHWMRVQAS